MRTSALLAAATLLFAGSAFARPNGGHGTQLSTGLNDCYAYDLAMGPGACMRDCDKVNRTPGWGCYFDPRTGKAVVRQGFEYLWDDRQGHGDLDLNPLRVPVISGRPWGLRVGEGVAQAWVGADQPLEIAVYAADGGLVATYEGVSAVELELAAGDYILLSSQGDAVVDVLPR